MGCSSLHDEDVLADRYGRLLDLGFDAYGAYALARAVDSIGFLVAITAVARLLERGATHAQAVAIYA